MTAKIFKQFAYLFESLMQRYDVDLLVCLPNPNRPDISRYAKIGCYVAMAWLLLVFAPIGMRMRTNIMEIYFPERSMERTVWLYHHILRKRTSFLKFVRRHIGRKKKNIKDNEHMTFAELLRAKVQRSGEITKRVLLEIFLNFFLADSGSAEYFYGQKKTRFACFAEKRLKGLWD